MATEPPNPAPPPSGPPPQPGPGASHSEWREWRHQQREYSRSQWRGHGWYGGPHWVGAWTWFWGAGLVLLGGYYLLYNLGLIPSLRPDLIWPVILILLGVGLLVSRSHGRWF
jgi:LiaI-LiaF-like transmembrane region